jgi:DNA-binding transcriptional LysR family regulator
MQRLTTGLAELETFIAVVERGGFSRAAELLHLSQSAVTKRVGRLEAELGVRLLNRTTRILSLTTAGRRLCIRSTPLVEQLRGALNDIREAAPSRSEVSILATPMVASVVLPALIRQFSSTNPGIHVVLRDLAPDQAVEELRSGLADFAVMVLDHVTRDLHYKTLVRDECVIVGPADHPAIVHGMMTLEQLVRHPLIAVPAQTTIWSKFAAELACRQVQFRPAHEANSLVAAIGMVEAGMGFTLVPEAILPCIHAHRVGWARIRGATIVREFGVVRLRQRRQSPAAQTFCRLLQAHMEKKREPGIGRLAQPMAISQATTRGSHAPAP